MFLDANSNSRALYQRRHSDIGPLICRSQLRQL